jgi:hypothetical protein
MSDDPVFPSPDGELPPSEAADAAPTISPEKPALETVVSAVSAEPAVSAPPASSGAPSEPAPASPPLPETAPPAAAAVSADPFEVEPARENGAPALGPATPLASGLALGRDFEADSESPAGGAPPPPSPPLSISLDPASSSTDKSEGEGVDEGEGEEEPARSAPSVEGDRRAPREESWRGGPSDGPPGSAKPRREERDRPRVPRGPRPDLAASEEPLYRESRGYRMRLEPPDLARLRELPGSKGKTDRELGEIFFDGQSERFTTSLAEDVPSPAEVRVVVDPYSRQAFLAVERKIRSILSF